MFKLSEHILTPVDLYRIVLSLLKKTTGRDIIKIIVLIGLFIFFKNYLHWQTDSSLFMIFWIALFLWNLDSRISIAGALACLVSCPILLILFEKDILLLGEEYAEQAAVWAYYFLVIGVLKQIWEFRIEDRHACSQKSARAENVSPSVGDRHACHLQESKTLNEIIQEMETKSKQNQEPRKIMDIIPPKK